MIEKYAITRVHAVGFAVIDGNPISIELSDSIGGTRIKRGGFFLRSFLHQAIQFRRRRLIKPGLLLEPQNAHGFEKTQGAQGVGIRRVLWLFERNSDVALRG